MTMSPVGWLPRDWVQLIRVWNHVYLLSLRVFLIWLIDWLMDWLIVIELIVCLFDWLVWQETRTKIDLRQCITDEVVPVSLGSSTEANTMELTTAWNIHNSGKNHSSTARSGLANLLCSLGLCSWDHLSDRWSWSRPQCPLVNKIKVAVSVIW